MSSNRFTEHEGPCWNSRGWKFSMNEPVPSSFLFPWHVSKRCSIRGSNPATRDSSAKKKNIVQKLSAWNLKNRKKRPLEEDITSWMFIILGKVLAFPKIQECFNFSFILKPTQKLTPIIMARWRMGLSPIVVTFQIPSRPFSTEPSNRRNLHGKNFEIHVLQIEWSQKKWGSI